MIIKPNATSSKCLSEIIFILHYLLNHEICEASNLIIKAMLTEHFTMTLLYTVSRLFGIITLDGGSRTESR